MASVRVWSRGRARLGCLSEGLQLSGWSPEWLCGCIVCGVSFSERTYRRHGMCKSCNRTETEEGRAPLRRVQFRAMRAGGTKEHALAIMLLEVVEAVGVQDAALMVGAVPMIVREWASRAVEIPPGWEEKIATAWIAVERGERWKVYQ